MDVARRDRGGDSSAVQVFVAGVKNHPRLASFVVLWILLAISFVYAPAPVVVTPAMQRQFDATLAKVPQRRIRAAMIAAADAEDEMAQYKVWFWRFRPDYKAQVERFQPEYDAVHTKLTAVMAERDEIMKEARQVVGIWSEYGVEEAREKFWENVERGKASAKRMTYWDTMFMAIGTMGRDEGLGAFIMRIIMRFAFNLTFGLIIMLIAFLFSLGSMVASFGPGFFSGTLFFLVAAAGATAVTFGIITCVFGSIGGGVYVMAKAAGNQRRLGGGGGYRRQYIGGQHYRRD